MKEHDEEPQIRTNRTPIAAVASTTTTGATTAAATVGASSAQAPAAIMMSATLSDCGTYRYVLRRQWVPDSESPRMICFVGLNPSTADAENDDQTIKKLIGFTQRWGFDGFKIVNLFALRSRDPKQLRLHGAPIGPENDEWIRKVANTCVRTVCCWGNNIAARNRGPQVLSLLLREHVRPWCFGKTADGFPKHPLLLPYSTKPIQYR